MTKTTHWACAIAVSLVCTLAPALAQNTPFSHQGRAGGAAAALMEALQANETSPPAAVDRDLFPQSVASGDPRPNSVVLWTRLVDPGRTGEDLPLELFVVHPDDGGRYTIVHRRKLNAAAEYDGVVKVKVDGLDPYSRYLYAFAYVTQGEVRLSPIGRTKTAPAPDADVTAKFTVISCQDYIGRYYNSYLEMLRSYDEELDFLVSVGDYVYETTGDPSFQNPVPGREMVFEDLEGAIRLGTDEQPFYAASSLSNYRTLYQTYRTDPVLQRIHESFPVVAVWDDHEYSDDSHGETATFFDGRRDEADVERKRRAERVFFEYMPNEVGLNDQGVLEITDDDLYPNTKIYDDYRYGKHLDLLLTDYRTYRPDHVVDEDAFPGGIAMDRETLETFLGAERYAAIAPSLDPYADLSARPELQAAAERILTQVYLLANPEGGPARAAARADEAVSGNVSASYLNGLFEAVGQPPPFPGEALARLERGLSYAFLGKTQPFTSNGSRYAVVRETYELLAAYLAFVTDGAAQDALGPRQRAWLGRELFQSDATWRVVGSSVSSTPMLIDFTNPAIASQLPEGFPDSLRTKLTLNVDQWDGFPDFRERWLDRLSSVPNTVLVAGDIHASFVTDHTDGLYEFTGPAISADTFGNLVESQAAANPDLAGVPGLDALLDQLDQLVRVSIDDPEISKSRIVFNESRKHGFMFFEAGPDRFLARYHLIDQKHVFESFYQDPGSLADIVEVRAFEVRGGELIPFPD